MDAEGWLDDEAPSIRQWPAVRCALTATLNFEKSAVGRARERERERASEREREQERERARESGAGHITISDRACMTAVSPAA